VAGCVCLFGHYNKLTEACLLQHSHLLCKHEAKLATLRHHCLLALAASSTHPPTHLPPEPAHACSMFITGLSYTATNLLYDFESEAPVQDNWEPYDCCGLIKTNAKQQQQQQQQQQQRGAVSAGQVVVRDDSAQLPKVPPARVSGAGPSPHQACKLSTDTGMCVPRWLGDAPVFSHNVG